MAAVGRSLAGEALRVLAVARRRHASVENAEEGLTFLALIGMNRPVAPRGARRGGHVPDGVMPVMITGDHPLTAEAIAQEFHIAFLPRVKPPRARA